MITIAMGFLLGMVFHLVWRYAKMKSDNQSETNDNLEIKFKKIQLNTGLKLIATPGSQVRYYIECYANDSKWVFINNDGLFFPIKLKDTIRNFKPLATFNIIPKYIAEQNMYWVGQHLLFNDKRRLMQLVVDALKGYADYSSPTEINLNSEQQKTENIPSETEIISKMIEAESNGDIDAENEMLDLWEINYKHKVI